MGLPQLRIAPYRAAVAAAVLLAGATVASAADTLTISPNKNPASAGETVTFTFSPPVRMAGDSVTFDFGDGMTGTVSFTVGCAVVGGCATIQHAFAGAGSFSVTASGTAGGREVAGSTIIAITATGPDTGLYVVTAAHLRGFKGTVWRTDLEVHNYGDGPASFTVDLLVRDQDNSNPQSASFTVLSDRSMRFDDIIDSVFHFNGAAALRITPGTSSLLITSRTYNQTDAGTYGQFVPASGVAAAINSGERARLIQLSHDPSLSDGFRTNVGLVSASSVPINVEVTFYTKIGNLLGSLVVELAPFEHRQLDKAFEQVTTDILEDGYVGLRTTTTGGRFFAYASVVDNRTGDPILIPAMKLH